MVRFPDSFFFRPATALPTVAAKLPRWIQYRCLDCKHEFLTMQIVPGDTPFWCSCPLPPQNAFMGKRACGGRATAQLENAGRDDRRASWEWREPQRAGVLTLHRIAG